MEHRQFYTFGFIVLVMVLFVTNLAQAKDPYYHMPAWDQKLACAPGKCPRFLVLADWGDSAAVLDKETGLVWERYPSMSFFTWENAQIHCNRLTTGGRLGWRLPTLQELASLVDPTVPSPGPTLPIGHPFTSVLTSFYWSATTSAPNTSSVWEVSFEFGDVDIFAKDGNNFVWCVRGGQGVDPQ